MMAARRRPYPTDLTDAQWQQIAARLPVTPGPRRSINLREIVNALRYRESTSCGWRMLPHDFPTWNTVYHYFRRWRADGTLSRLQNVLQKR